MAIVNGTNAADYLVGTAGSDTMNGLSGNDFLFGSAGNDFMFGGDGNDYEAGNDGDDYLVGGGGRDTLHGGTGNDHIYGGEGNDVLDGGGGNDILDGGDGNDSLYSGDGGYGTLHGGNGIDHLYGGQILDGGAGADTLEGVKVSYAGSNAGVSVLFATGFGYGGWAEGDHLIGTRDVTGSSYADTIIGDAGVNAFSGGSGNDELRGAGGNDGIYGGAGDDRLYGGAGSDMFVAGAGADLMNGGDGYDSVDFEDSKAGVTVDLIAGTGSGGDATGDTFVSIEKIYGSGYADTLTGGTLMMGYGGDDVLIGGPGRQTMDGVTGANSFVYLLTSDSTAATGIDYIAEFQRTDGEHMDHIDLSAIDADVAAVGNQAFTFIGTAAFSGAGQVRWDSIGSMVQANTGGDAKPEMEISVEYLGDGPISAIDFFL